MSEAKPLMSPTSGMFRSNHLGRSRAFYIFTGLAVFIFCLTLASLARHGGHSGTPPTFTFKGDLDSPPSGEEHHSILEEHRGKIGLHPQVKPPPPMTTLLIPQDDIPRTPIKVPDQHREKNDDPKEVHFEGVKSKYAFATFLVGSEDKDMKYEDNHYFIATRLLTYQLLHNEKTRCRDRNIPFLVVVTDRVPERNRQILRDDGATVVLVPGMHMDWLAPSISDWEHVMTKLRLWEFVDFERIAFVDADTVLTGTPIDDIFDDPAVKEQKTLDKPEEVTEGAPPMPSSYVFAGNAEFEHVHEYPPTLFNGAYANAEYLNAGFFVLKPDIELLKYYIHFLNTPESFDSKLPEQNLLNHVHRRQGNMPWAQLENTMNVHYPTIEDIDKGARTIHEKWWYPSSGRLRDFMESWRWRMEGFFEAKGRAKKIGYDM